MPDLRRAARALVLFLAFVATLPVAALVGLNAFLNLGLPILLNLQPERMRMRWSWAWSWDARRVEVHGFDLRVQGPLDQWWLTVERGELRVELEPLLERRFQADDLHAEGAVFRYRGRLDAPARPGLPPATYEEGVTAPIPGLENPPLERPEDLYPPPPEPWLIALDDVEVEHIRELWLGDYRFVGDATLGGDLIVLPEASIDLSGATLDIWQGDVLHDDIPVVAELSGEAELSLEGIDPATMAGVELFGPLTGRLAVSGRVYDLSYLDIFLSDAPWLGLSGGSGALELDLRFDHGRFDRGSRAWAEVADLRAHVGSYAALGDARVSVAVEDSARLHLSFDRYLIHRGEDPTPFVRGHGFRLDAEAPALRIDRPPDGFVAVATLPRSEVPDLRIFRAYLPGEVGLDIRGGHATVEGQARIGNDGDSVSGEITVNVPSFDLGYNGLPIRGAARVEGRVVSGRLDVGRYDIRGSRFAVERLAVGDKPPDWWARLDVRRGRVDAGADTFLSASSDFACRDTSPLFRIAVGQRKIAPFVEQILTFRDLEGEARAAFGQTSIAIQHLHVHTPKAEVHVHLDQRGTRVDALLFARLGLLGVATRVAGDEYELQLLDAKKWFHARLAEAGTPEPMTNLRGETTAAEDTKADKRKGIKFLGSKLKELFTPKKPKPKAE